MGAQFDIAVSGINELKRAVQEIEKTAAAELALQKQSLDTANAIKGQLVSGFEMLERELKKVNATLAANTAATKTNTAAKKEEDAATQKQITSAKQLATAWKAEGAVLSEITAQLNKQAAASEKTAAALTSLTVNSNRYIKAAREAFLADQANIAQANQLSSAYSRIAALMGQRANLESGATRKTTERIAREEALLAVTQQQLGLSQSSINALKAQIVAESQLNAVQKQRALNSLGLVNEAKALRTMEINSMGVSKAQRDHMLISEGLASSITRQAKAVQTGTMAWTNFGATMRGVSAATGTIFLTYGKMVPMITAFVTAMTGIKSIKVGAEFDQQVKYIAAFQEESRGAVMSINAIKDGLLGIKGVGKTPYELAIGMKELVKAGVSAQDALSGVRTMAQFATIAETDMEKAAKMVATQWLAWGPTSKAAERGVKSMGQLMDYLSAVITYTGADMESLATSVKYLGSLSGTSGATYSNLLALAGALHNVGIVGSMSGTSVRNALLKIQQSSEKLIKGFKDYGIEFNPFKNRNEFKQDIELLREFEKSLSQLPGKEISKMAHLGYGMRGVNVSAVDFRKTLTDVGVSLDKLADKRTNLEDLEQTFKDINDYWDGVAAGKMKKSLVDTIFGGISDNAVFKFSEVKSAIERNMAEAFDSKIVNDALDKIIVALNNGLLKDAIVIIAKFSNYVISAIGYVVEVLDAIPKPVYTAAAAFGAFLLASSVITKVVALVIPLQKALTAVAFSMAVTFPAASNKAIAAAGWVGGAFQKLNAVLIGAAMGWAIGSWLNEFDIVKRGAAATIFYVTDQFINLEYSLKIAAVAVKEVFAEMWYDVKMLAYDAYKFMADKAKFLQFMPGAMGTMATAMANSNFDITPPKKGGDFAGAGIAIGKLEASRARELADNLKTYHSVVDSIGKEAPISTEMAKAEERSKMFLKGLEDAEKEFNDMAGAAGGAGAAFDQIDLGALRDDIQRFKDSDGSSLSKFTSQLGNEVDGYIEKAKKLAAQNKTSISEVWKQLGTSEAELRKFEKAKIDAFRTEKAQEFADKIEDIGGKLTELKLKADIGDKFAEGVVKVEKVASQLNKDIREAAQKAFDDGVVKSYDEGLQRILNKYGLTKKELEDIVVLSRQAFATDLIEDYEQSFNDLRTGVLNVSEEQRLLNEHTKKFQDAEKDLIATKGAYKSRDGDLAEVNKKMAELVALKEYDLSMNPEYLKSTNNLWNGFRAGAIEAQRELKNLGALGNEIFQDMQSGFKTIFVDAIKGDFKKIGGDFNEMLKNMKNTLIDWAADQLATMASNAVTNVVGGLLSEIGLGGLFGERGSNPGNPVFVSDVSGGLGGGGGAFGGLFGSGGFLSKAKGWVGSIFGETVANWLGKITSGLGLIGGAYGMYSGLKNLFKGKGSTAGNLASVGLGAASAYQGAVGLGLIESGTATALAQSALSKLGITIGEKAGESLATSMAAEGAERAATYQAQQALFSSGAQGTSSVAASYYGSTLAKSMAAEGAERAAMYQSQQALFSNGAQGVSSTAGGSGASAATAAGKAGAIAIVAFLAYKGIDKILNPTPSPSAEIDKFGITPEHLQEFSEGLAAINGTILESIPGVRSYDKALYESDKQRLTLQKGSNSYVMGYDASAPAGHRWDKQVFDSSGLISGNLKAPEFSSENATNFSGAGDYMSAVLVAKGLGEATSKWMARANQLQKDYNKSVELNYISTLKIATATEVFSDNADGSTVTAEEQQRRFKELEKKYDDTNSSVTELAGGLTSLDNAVGVSSVNISDLSDNGFELSKTFSNVAGGANEVAGSMGTMVAVIGSMGNEAADTANTLVSATGGLKEVGSEVGGLTQTFDKMTSKMSEMEKVALQFSTVSLPGAQSMENAKGGPIGYAGGGVLRGGSGTKDDLYLGTVNGRAQFAMGGEYIVNKKSTRKHKGLLEFINADTYASGGDLPSLMSGVQDTIIKYTKSDAQYSLYQLTEQFKELTKSLEEAGASADQLAEANRAYSLEKGALYGPKSEMVGDMVREVSDRYMQLSLSDGLYNQRSIMSQYKETIMTLRDYGASTAQIAQVQRTYALELAKAYGPKSDTVVGLMEGIYDTIAEAKLSDAQYSIRAVNIQYKKLIEDLKGSGASTAQLTTAIQAWKIELDAMADQPLKDASSALKSFTDNLKGVTDESIASTTAQAKLMTMLAKAKKGDFSGVEKLSEILDDIVINKEDYSTAIDYARAYWGAIGAATQLTTLIDKKVALPGYAAGGTHPGGLRVVGESGPELEVTGPSRIYNQNQLIDVSAILEELKALRKEVVNGNYAVAKNTMKTAESLQRIEYDGIYLDAGSM